MKRILLMFLLVLGLVAASQARKDYSPEESEDYSSVETSVQIADLDDRLQDLRGLRDDSMKYVGDAKSDGELQDRRGFSDESMEYLEDAQLEELQELRGINDAFIDFPEDISNYDRNRRGRGEHLRSSMRKVGKSMKGKKPKTPQGTDNQDGNSMLESMVDDNLTYVTGRPLPAQDRNYPIPRTLAEQVLQIIGNITIGEYGFEIPMKNMRCSSSSPVLDPMPYSHTQLTIKIDAIVNTECSYHKSSSTNTATTTASVIFSMSPEPHFIINKVEVEPDTDNDFQDNIGSENNPLDSILARSGQLIKLYLQESVAAVFYSLKRFD